MSAIYQRNTPTISANFLKAVLEKLIKDPASVLPDELMIRIFSLLDLNEINGCSLVCKKWRKISTDKILLNQALIGKIALQNSPLADFFRFNLQEAISSLPQNILDILKSPCPILRGKFIFQTHILAWIPTTIQDEPTTINKLGTLIQSRFPDHDRGYISVRDVVLSIIGDRPLDGSSRWVLMSKSSLEGSILKGEDELQAMVDSLSQDSKATYRIPSTLEALIAIFTNYLNTGEYILNTVGTFTEPLEENSDLIWVASDTPGNNAPPNNPNLGINMMQTGGCGWVGVAPVRTL